MEDAHRVYNEAQLKETFADTRLHETTVAQENAKSALADARQLEDDTRALARKVHSSLTHREELVAGREKNATLVEIDLSTREKALADGLVQLTDREATLARNYQRLHTKHV